MAELGTIMNRSVARHIVARLALGTILQKEAMEKGTNAIFSNEDDLKNMLSYGKVPDFCSENTKHFVFIVHRLYRALTEKKLKQIYNACCIFIQYLKKDIEKHKIYFNTISMIALACKENFNKHHVNYCKILSTFAHHIFPKWSSKLFFESATPSALIDYQNSLIEKYQKGELTFDEMFEVAEGIDFNICLQKFETNIDDKGNVEFAFMNPDKKVERIIIKVNENDNLELKPKLFKKPIMGFARW